MPARTHCIDPPDIDIFADDVLTFAQAAKRFPKDRRPSPVTLWRWHRKGKHGVHLPALDSARGLVTTEAAIRWFHRELQRAPRRDTQPRQRPGTRAEREALDAQCAEMGI